MSKPETRTWLIAESYSGELPEKGLVQVTNQPFADKTGFTLNTNGYVAFPVERWAAEGLCRVLNRGAALEREVGELRTWREAVRDAGVNNWTLSEANYDDPRKAIQDLIQQVISEQFDPAISEKGKELAELRAENEALTEDARKLASALASGIGYAAPLARTALAAHDARTGGTK